MYKEDYSSNAVVAVELFEKELLKQDLSKAEVNQVYEYALRLTFLESYGSVNKNNIEEVAVFFNYFCNKYDSYSSLPEQVKSSFDVVYFAHPEALMNTAYISSACPDKFMADIIDEFSTYN